jgi:hypothetical protein
MASNNPSDSVTTLLRASSGGGKLTSGSEQLQALQAINDALMRQSAAAMATGSSAGGSGAGSGSGSVASSVLDAIGGGLLSGGLGLSSMLSGITSLFGGGDSASAPPVLTPYVHPLPIHLDAGFSDANGGSAFGVDAAQGGTPRAMTGGAVPAQVTIQVQALDSQSFLDHSNDIAMAVRQAMLETTVLNDVIRSV